MRIDSHHHVWDLSVREQGWMVGEALDPIKKNFSINDLRQAITGCGIEKTVVVQTVTNYDETPELLELAEDDDLVAGVVGFLKNMPNVLASSLISMTAAYEAGAAGAGEHSWGGGQHRRAEPADRCGGGAADGGGA